MQKIYDNISNHLKTGLREGLEHSIGADFCIGYFTLGGFDLIGDLIFEQFLGENNSCCRILVGKNENYPGSNSDTPEILTEKFIEKLRTGASANDKDKLERLKHLIKLKKLHIKFSTSNLIHAKLYIFHANFRRTSGFAITGSSNLTYNGLMKSQELNVVISEKDTCLALQEWFKNQWNLESCLDVSNLIAWADYKEISQGDLFSLATICEKYQLTSLVSYDGSRHELPAAFSCDEEGIDEWINPDFEEAIRCIFQEQALDDVFFPNMESIHDEFPYPGMSVKDYIVESFFDPLDPTYIDPDLVEEVARQIAKDVS
jgi:PLD-like domain